MRSLSAAETAPTVQCQVNDRKGRRPGEAGRDLCEGLAELMCEPVELQLGGPSGLLGRPSSSKQPAEDQEALSFQP